MGALLVGFAATAAYSLFLLVKASLALYREGEKKLIFCLIVFMVIAPALVWLSGFIPEERTSMWTVLPTLLLFLLWVFVGYFLEIYRKNKAKLRSMGIDKRPEAPPGLMRRNCLLFATGLGIWLYGAFVGVGNDTVDICLLCVCVFLLAVSTGMFWKYRKF